MGKIEKFEDIVSWQKARALTREIYNTSFNQGRQQDFNLRDQMRRAAVSIMANIAEGFERSGNKEFHQFLALAKGSCGEVRSHLYVALDQEYITKEEFETLVARTEELSGLIVGFMKYLQKTELRGSKYK